MQKEMNLMTGKEKCTYLKKIRAEIAMSHGINGFEYTECNFQGECSGTCPACDAEAEALYEKLRAMNLDIDAFALKGNELALKLGDVQINNIPKKDSNMLSGKIVPNERVGNKQQTSKNKPELRGLLRIK